MRRLFYAVQTVNYRFKQHCIVELYSNANRRLRYRVPFAVAAYDVSPTCTAVNQLRCFCFWSNLVVQYVELISLVS